MSKFQRVIPRLDVKGPNLIKGVCFEGMRALGRPGDFAERYQQAGADELILYDTVASLFQRPPGYALIEEVADRISIPLTVAGGIDSVETARRVLRAGADKVAVNTAAVARPELLGDLTAQFGAQSVLASVEVLPGPSGGRFVMTEYGRQSTALQAERWVDRVIEAGVGEILLSAIDRDGLGRGADVDFIAWVVARAPMPVIAGAGVGSAAHAAAAFAAGADAVHVASLLHYAHADPVPRRYMNSDRSDLRCGADDDLGNVTWLNHGYGDQRAAPSPAMPLGALKRGLWDAGWPVRMDGAEDAPESPAAGEREAAGG